MNNLIIVSSDKDFKEDKSHYKKVLETMINENGFDINKIDKETGYNFIIKQIKENDLDTFKFLIKEYNSEIQWDILKNNDNNNIFNAINNSKNILLSYCELTKNKTLNYCDIDEITDNLFVHKIVTKKMQEEDDNLYSKIIDNIFNMECVNDEKHIQLIMQKIIINNPEITQEKLKVVELEEISKDKKLISSFFDFFSNTINKRDLNIKLSETFEKDEDNKKRKNKI